MKQKERDTGRHRNDRVRVSDTEREREREGGGERQQFAFTKLAKKISNIIRTKHILIDCKVHEVIH